MLPTLASPLASPSRVVDALANHRDRLDGPPWPGALVSGTGNGTGLDARNVPPRLTVPQFNDFLEHLSTWGST